MSSPEIEDKDTVMIPEDKVEKEEMVEYLTSEGKIRNKVANDMFDAGLDNWHALVNGDLEFFTSFKNVGKKTAENLIEMGKAKKKELQEKLNIPTLEEVLMSIPRVSETVIGTLKEAGYNTFEKFKDLDPEELRVLKGIGPKLSVMIVEKVNEARENFNITGQADEVEDAIGSIDEEPPAEESADKEEKGFFQKLVDGIKSIFSGKKEEETPEEKEEPVEEEKEEESPEEEEVPAGESEEEPPVEPVKEEKEEGPPEEEKPEEESTAEEEEKEEVPDEVEKEEESPAEEEAKEEEPAEQEKGFFQKLKERFFGPSGEKTEEEEKVEEEEEKEVPVEEEEKVEEEEEKEVPVEEEEPAQKETPAKGKGPLGLKGVSVKTQEKLMASGYHNVEELKEAVPEDLTMIDGIGEATARKICEAVKE